MSLRREQVIDALTKARAAAPPRGFEQSVELIVNLKDIDFKKPEKRINLRVEVPNGFGGRRVLIFASGDLALRARRAGADAVIEPSELEAMAKDKKEMKRRLKEFDIFYAEATLMPLVGRLVGPFLGPRGRMPTPIPSNVPVEGVVEAGRRAVFLRSRDKPLIQCAVGSEKMEDSKIAENIEAVLSSLTPVLDRGYGNIRSAYVKLTMGPAVRLM
jgi:large subunit ribosomal protein L1